MNLVVFLTRGQSLQNWFSLGMADRELALYRALVAAGVRVALVTYGDRRDLRCRPQLRGIRILCNRWGLAPVAYERWLTWLHAPWLRSADLYKSNQTDGADVALWAARRWKKPVVARCGYMWSEFVERQHGDAAPITQRAKAVEALVFQAASRIVVTTPAMAAQVCTRLPAVAERVQVIPNYVETDVFCPAASGQRSDRLLFVGRLNPQKNVDALLTAARYLDCALDVIGQGESGPALKREFADMSKNVRWLPNIPNHELPAWFNHAALYVLPSHYEGHPKSLLEAMACGAPVLGTDVPGIRELVRHGETGWLCDPDAQHIGFAIRYLMERPDLRERLGRQARQYVQANFSLDKIAKMEMEMYSEILSVKRGC